MAAKHCLTFSPPTFERDAVCRDLFTSSISTPQAALNPRVKVTGAAMFNNPARPQGDVFHSKINPQHDRCTMNTVICHSRREQTIGPQPTGKYLLSFLMREFINFPCGNQTAPLRTHAHTTALSEQPASSVM